MRGEERRGEEHCVKICQCEQKLLGLNLHCIDVHIRLRFSLYQAGPGLAAEINYCREDGEGSAALVVPKDFLYTVFVMFPHMCGPEIVM